MSNDSSSRSHGICIGTLERTQPSVHQIGERLSPGDSEEGTFAAVGVAGGDDAAVVAGHLDAIAVVLAGDPTALDPFRGVVLLVQLVAMAHTVALIGRASGSRPYLDASSLEYLDPLVR